MQAIYESTPTATLIVVPESFTVRFGKINRYMKYFLYEAKSFQRIRSYSIDYHVEDGPEYVEVTFLDPSHEFIEELLRYGRKRDASESAYLDDGGTDLVNVGKAISSLLEGTPTRISLDMRACYTTEEDAEKVKQVITHLGGSRYVAIEKSNWRFEVGDKGDSVQFSMEDEVEAEGFRSYWLNMNLTVEDLSIAEADYETLENLLGQDVLDVITSFFGIADFDKTAVGKEICDLNIEPEHHSTELYNEVFDEEFGHQKHLGAALYSGGHVSDLLVNRFKDLFV